MMIGRVFFSGARSEAKISLSTRPGDKLKSGTIRHDECHRALSLKKVPFPPELVQHAHSCFQLTTAIVVCVCAAYMHGPLPSARLLRSLAAVHACAYKSNSMPYNCAKEEKEGRGNAHCTRVLP